MSTFTKNTGQLTLTTKIEKNTISITLNDKSDATNNSTFSFDWVKDKEILSFLLAYGIGRHAPDNTSIKSSTHYKDVAEYLTCYTQGYISPKEKEKALKPSATAKGKASAFNREGFESFLTLEKEVPANVLASLDSLSLPEFLSVVKAHPKLSTYLEAFEAKEAEEAKRLEEEEEAKVKSLLDSIDF